MAYPSTLTALSNPQATDRLNSPSHSALHQNENTGITEIQTFVGTLSSAVGTLVYDIRSANSNGGGHIQTANTGGTGQTSFNKGDLLVGQSSSVLTKLAIASTNGLALVIDSTQATGMGWSGVAPLNYQAFTVSSVWTKPNGLSGNEMVKVQLWGGGGGGGTVGGGGGGAYVEYVVPASILTSSVIVTVGASVANTVNGNPTSFGSIVTAYAGAAGGGTQGGGGGGVLGNGSGTTGGAPLGGVAGTTGTSADFGGAGGGTNVGGNSAWGGGGGSSSNGGNSLYGGGGGGGASGSPSAGTSLYGGNGGLSSVAGTAPGGGGGANASGARGEVRVWIL